MDEKTHDRLVGGLDTNTTSQLTGSSAPSVPAEESEERSSPREDVTAMLRPSTSACSSLRSKDWARPNGVLPTPTKSTYDYSERNPTALSRIQTARSVHNYTIGPSPGRRSSSTASKTPLLRFGGGKPFPPPLPEQEAYVVEFDGPDDPLHAQNWPMRKKIVTAVILSWVTLVSAFGSSIFSSVIDTVAGRFNVSSEVGILGVSLYVLGFAFGPLLWAPASELFGRKWPIIVASFMFSIFNVAVAVAKDLQTVFICSFFAGFSGACPLAVVGAVFADMFNNRQRGLAITAFAMTVFCGPLLAPFIGGFIDMSHLGWRWTEYITCIMGFLGLALCVLFLKETYSPLILVAKAAELRRQTKNWGIHAKQEEVEIDFNELVEKNLSRPLRMLVTEPIVLALSVYVAFVYGLFYLFLSFYPIVFQEKHGFNRGVGALPFLGMIVGELIAALYMIIIQPAYNKKLAKNNNMPIPEWRLPPVIIGGVVFAMGFLWFGWTGYRADINWSAPTLSGLFTGFGFMLIFLQCINYLIDAYLMFAASAIAANTLLRSLAGSGFPMFATYMINGMGVQWAGTLLGCVAFALVPLPILFYLKGATIREKSTFAPTFSLANEGNAPVDDVVDEEKEG